MAEAVTTRARSGRVSGARFLIITIATITGVCFAVLAGLSISAIYAPVRRVHALSVVIALLGLVIAFLAFRVAKAGYTDTITAAEASFRGLLGAFAGLFGVGLYLYLFRPDALGTIAHALGRPASAFSVLQVLIASALLGFGAGFVARIRITRGR